MAIDLLELCAVDKIIELFVRAINCVAILVKEPGVRIERRQNLVLQLRKLFGNARERSLGLAEQIFELKVLIDFLEKCCVLWLFIVGVQLDFAVFCKHVDLLFNGIDYSVGSTIANAVDPA